MRSATGVPPGSRVKCVGVSASASSGLRARTSVDLPEKSGPSMVTKMPREARAVVSPSGRGSAQGVALGGGDEGPEEVAVLGSRVAHGRRVPLHPYQPPLREIPPLEGLHHPVGGGGNRDEAGGEILHRLVVVGVDL